MLPKHPNTASATPESSAHDASSSDKSKLRSNKHRPKNIAPESQRDPEIRKNVARKIGGLVKLYEMTDPGRGSISEEDKLEYARQAIETWWYLFGELLLWAQSQIAGYEICKANPGFLRKLKKRLGHEITGDSHILEYIGLTYSFNWPNHDDLLESVEGWMEKDNVGLDGSALRYLIRELLMSRSANSSFWRFELQRGLYALNWGTVEEIFKPVGRRQGDPLSLLEWKMAALQQVFFKVGKGIKKSRARETVANAIGQSVETLRSWEKLVSQDDDLFYKLSAAELAGELETEFDKSSFSELIKSHGARYHRRTADLEYAMRALSEIRSASLDAIRNGLRQGRMAKKAGI
jgi:hypothetical protein